MTTKTESVTMSLRMPPEMRQQLKEEHANTFADHRLSFNAWLLVRIQAPK